MKTTLRIVIILAVTLAISAAALVIANHNGIVSAHTSEGEEEPRSSEGIKGAGLGSGQGRGSGQGIFSGSHSEEEAIGETLPGFEIIKHVGVTVVFILVITLMERIIKRGRKRKELTPAL